MMDTKRVKFDIDEDEFDGEIEINSYNVTSGNASDNDLDLDTIKSSRNKAKGLKEFDSEGSEEEEEEEDENVSVVVNIHRQIEMEMETETDSEGSEELELEPLAEFDDRQIPIEPFNLKADREEGSFDSEGFYVKKHDEEADQDRWMAHFTPSDIQKARRAHTEIEQKRLQKKMETVVRSEKELWEELAREMDGFDEDLSLLGVITSLKSTTESSDSNFIKPRAPLNKNRLKKLQKEQGLQAEASLRESSKMTPEKRAKLEKLTELADSLMDLGYFGVYEESRRGILSK